MNGFKWLCVKSCLIPFYHRMTEPLQLARYHSKVLFINSSWLYWLFMRALYCIDKLFLNMVSQPSIFECAVKVSRFFRTKVTHFKMNMVDSHLQLSWKLRNLENNRDPRTPWEIPNITSLGFDNFPSQLTDKIQFSIYDLIQPNKLLERKYANLKTIKKYYLKPSTNQIQEKCHNQLIWNNLCLKVI